MDGLLMK